MCWHHNSRREGLSMVLMHYHTDPTYQSSVVEADEELRDTVTCTALSTWNVIHIDANPTTRSRSSLYAASLEGSLTTQFQILHGR